MGLARVLFSFHGRINRLQYWTGNTVVSLLGGLAFGGAVFNISSGLMNKSANPLQFALPILVLIVVLAVALWCGLALQVKRLHDRGRSGYIALAPSAVMTALGVTVITNIAAGAPPGEVAASVQPFLIAMSLLNLFLFVDLGCLESVSGPNKYDDPGGLSRKKDGAAAVASSLLGAHTAIERAIAAQSGAKLETPRRPPPATPAPVAAAPSFGRRAPR
jgi:uncharacterized membrane protein YhaH (DUF805 family)